MRARRRVDGRVRVLGAVRSSIVVDLSRRDPSDGVGALVKGGCFQYHRLRGIASPHLCSPLRVGQKHDGDLGRRRTPRLRQGRTAGREGAGVIPEEEACLLRRRGED